LGTSHNAASWERLHVFRVVFSSARILKGKPMNWDQIEVKWAAMARRVRSDLPQNTRLAISQTTPLTKPTEVPEPTAMEVGTATAR
jgi:hypothetical protein